MDGMLPSELPTAYPPPLDALIALGEPPSWQPAEWTDYRQAFGLDRDHVPGLIRLACDMTLYQRPTDDPGVWAAVHAWRALAQCRAEAAAPALTDLLVDLDDDDYAGEELPLVLGMIGAAAIAPIAAQLADGNRSTRVGRLPSALAEIAQRHPEARAGCIEVLASLLPGSAGDGELAGFAVSALLDLRAVESIAAIRDAFARDAVDLSIVGDVEDVEIELGLRNERDTPRPRYIGWPGLERVASQPGAPWLPQAPVRVEKIGRNEPCPCGSGRKYKKCCLG